MLYIQNLEIKREHGGHGTDLSNLSNNLGKMEWILEVYISVTIWSLLTASRDVDMKSQAISYPWRQGKCNFEFASYLPLTVLKVKLVEVHPLHEVSQCFRFKWGQPRITDLPITNEVIWSHWHLILEIIYQRTANIITYC